MLKSNIRLQRLVHGNMTQKQLSKLTGIRLPTLSEYENGTSKTLRVEYISKLCEVFDCQISDLFTYCTEENENLSNKEENKTPIEI